MFNLGGLKIFGKMKDKKLEKITEKHGTIVRLTDAEKQQAIQKGYQVQEIETPCGAGGYQGVSRPN